MLDGKWDLKAFVKDQPDLPPGHPAGRGLRESAGGPPSARGVRAGQHPCGDGLLVREIGGPSVKPFQPAYYRHLNFPRRSYNEDPVMPRRRGLYVHWQRQFLHPMMKAFDAPSREECTTQRPQSMLAALVLLNDPTSEGGQGLADKIASKGGDSSRTACPSCFQRNTLAALIEDRNSESPENSVARAVLNLAETHLRR